MPCVSENDTWRAVLGSRLFPATATATTASKGVFCLHMYPRKGHFLFFSLIIFICFLMVDMRAQVTIVVVVRRAR